MKRSLAYWTRRSHRYLGLLLGIQFLLWTIGGIYFSWSDIDEIHGDHHKSAPPLLRADYQLVSPQKVLDALREKHPFLAIVSLQLVDILGEPVYQLVYLEKAGIGETPQRVLADAVTGKVRGLIQEKEAIAIANSRFNETAEVESVQYLTSVPDHHEYRESPLPAYAIRFAHPSRTTVYVASELGTIQSFRNQKWRVFDFLWMLHTMDYATRDNFGNLLLRVFSVFGLITIISGFILFYLSSPTFRKLRKKAVTSHK